MTDPQPVVTVAERTPDGIMVRWHRTVGDARTMNPVLTATQLGVMVSTYVTDVPDEWLAAAKAAHQALKGGSDEQLAAVSRLATHRNRFPGGGGPLDPVEDSAEA